MKIVSLFTRLHVVPNLYGTQNKIFWKIGAKGFKTPVDFHSMDKNIYKEFCGF